MATVTLILGKSGSGKSASLRNLPPTSVALIQVIPKPLPFKGAKAWKPYVTDDWQKVIGRCVQATKHDRKIIVIDDFQYILANEFMRRSEEKGFDKFTEIGRHTWNIFEALLRLPDDVRVYILSHTEETDAGVPLFRMGSTYSAPAITARTRQRRRWACLTTTTSRTTWLQSMRPSSSTTKSSHPRPTRPPKEKHHVQS